MARHWVLLGAKPSAGQAGPVPGHCSATSQAPAEARQVEPAATKRAAHESLVPSQVSSTSQAWPLLARQMVPIGRLASEGQVLAVPLHVSGWSHGPAPARHTTVVSATRVAQAAVRPSQMSLTSHAPLAGRQTVLAFAKALEGQLGDVPLHSSAGSHGPVEARHWSPMKRRPLAGQVALTPSHDSATSQTPAAGRQTTAEPERTSAGHAVPPPEQNSCGSQVP